MAAQHAQTKGLPTNRFIRFLALSESLHRLVPEFAAQQATWIIRYPTQPLLQCLLLFKRLVKLGHLFLSRGLQRLGIHVLRVSDGGILLTLLLLLFRFRLVTLTALALVAVFAVALFLLSLI